MSKTSKEDLEIGDWGLEIGDWRLEIGDWGLEIGDWRLEISPSFVTPHSSDAKSDSIALQFIR